MRNYGDDLVIGSIFSRVDKNGKKHMCRVAYKTKYQVALDCYNPYKNEWMLASPVDGQWSKIIIRFDKEKQNYYIKTNFGLFYLED